MANLSPQSAKSIYFSAIDIVDGAERSEFVRRSCRDNESLWAEVEQLLAAHEVDRSSLLSQAIRQLNPEAEQEQPKLPAEELRDKDATFPDIDRYKLLEVIGRGGMGTVYMAQQIEPVRRQVALKLINPGMNSRQVVARFEAERQALALMDHPCIARVLDAGVAKNGQPYIAMELVRGIPITEFCDVSLLSNRERLQLMAEVCRAVQHAHQKGIVHRDLKPSNVLVTMHDDRPIPKIIDFGVAKALDQPLIDQTLVTRFGQMIGMPLYMSPEQTQMNELDVDTRSDVYSLGVMLYELLTGATPFDRETLKQAGFDVARRIIREDDPPCPSERLSTLAASDRSTVSEKRGRDPRQLSQSLRGELDWIVMRALEKDRTRRYDSAGAFADDIGRYLAKMPIEAGPPGITYRIKKFVQRNRGRVTAAVSAIAILVVSAIVNGVLLWRSNQKTAQALAEAKAALNFLIYDMLEAATPAGNQGQELTVSQALANAEKKVSQQFRERPLTEAAVRQMMGETYQALGNYELAEQHFKNAAEIRERLLRRDHPESLTSLHGLATTYHNWGREQQAAEVHAEVLQRRRRSLGPRDPMTIESMGSYANCLRYLPGQMEKAIQLHREALDIASQRFGDDHKFTIRCLSDLCVTLNENRETVQEGARLLADGLRRSRQVFGERHPTTLNFITNLVVSLVRQNRLDEALPLAQEGLAAEADLLGTEHPSTLISVLNLSGILHDLGRAEDVVELLEPARPAFQRAFGDHHRVPIFATKNLGMALWNLGRHSEAAEVFAEGAMMCRQSDEFGPYAGMTLTLTLAAARFDEQRLQDFRTLVDDACTAAAGMPEATVRCQSLRSRAFNYYELAGRYRCRGDLQHAEDLYRQALAIVASLEMERDEDDYRYMKSWFGLELVNLLIERGHNNDESRRLLEEGLATMKDLVLKLLDDIDYRLLLARIYHLLFEITSDKAYRQQACELAESAARDAPHTAAVQCEQARLWLDGLYDGATDAPERAAEKAMRILKPLYDREPGNLDFAMQLGEAYEKHALALKDTGQIESGSTSLDAAIATLSSLLQMEPNYQVARDALQRCEQTRMSWHQPRKTKARSIERAESQS